MVSCAKTDVMNEAPEMQTGKITFASHINKATRAIEGDVTTGNLRNFYVCGSYHLSTMSEGFQQIFNNVHLQRDGETNTWNQIDGQTRYWVPGAQYEFFAYSDGDDATDLARYSHENGKPNLLIWHYKVDNDNQRDLIFATHSRPGDKVTAEGNDNVAFLFTHILSKVKFTFVSAFPAENTIKITNLRLNNIHSLADYNTVANQGVWSDYDDEHRINNFSFSVNQMAQAAATEGGESTDATSNTKYVLPFTYKTNNVQVQFTISIYNKDVFLYAANMQASFKPFWEPGKAYNYIVTLTGQEAGMQKIEFELAKDSGVKDWENGNIQDENNLPRFEATLPNNN